MRGVFAIGLALALGGGCTLKLAGNARDQGRASMDCKEAKYKVRAASAEDRRIVVYGCGEYETYEGNCNGELNGCDHSSATAGCDGACKLRRTGHGELTEAGEIPDGVLKGEELDE